MNYIKPSYLMSFECLKTLCPDTCCSTWQIPVTKDDMTKLGKVIPIHHVVEPIHHQGQLPYHGVLKKHQNVCSQLHNGLCNLHAKYGENILPSICHDFPFEKSTNQHNSEIYATFACPAVAKSFLHWDGNFDSASNKHMYKTHSLTEAPLALYRQLLDIIIHNFDYDTMWCCLLLYAIDIEKMGLDVASEHWVTTLSDTAMDSVHVKRWLEGNFYFGHNVFHSLQPTRSALQNKVFDAIRYGDGLYPDIDDKNNIWETTMQAHESFFKSYIRHELYRHQFPFVESPVLTLKSIGINTFLIKWLYTMGNIADTCTMDDVLVVHNRWYQHNQQYQKDVQALMSDSQWGHIPNFIGLMV